ncbi:MAG TPA: glycosyltransferase family 39 protein [bacterium]|nr:glycosyltransferase family 39 protein [bacterium]
MKRGYLYILLLIAFFSFSYLHVDTFNVDAQHWMLRSSNFMSALLKLNFAKTFQDPKPGVPVMFLSGFFIEFFLRLYKLLFSFRPEFYTYDTFFYLNFVSRFPLVLLNLVFLYFSYRIVRVLFDEYVSLLYLILLGFQPFYIANSRFLHVDITLTVFMNMSFFLFLLFYEKGSKKLYLISSGVFAGLALLTKTQALFLFPMMGLITLLIFPRSFSGLWTCVKNFIIWIFTSIVCYLLFFPALWVNPVMYINKIFSEALFVANTGNTNIFPFLYYFQILRKDLSLVGLIISLIATFYCFFIGIRSRKDCFLYLSLFFFIFFYFLQMSIIKQKIDRYLLPMYPVLALCVSIFCLNNPFLKKIKYKTSLIVAFFLVQVAILAYYFPNYYSFVVKDFYDNKSGVMFPAVGKYINSQENPYELKVVTMTKVASLRPFVKGKVFGHEEDLPNNWSIDYLVTNDYWLERYGEPEFFESCFVEEKISFRGVPYWDIYRCNKN